MVRVRLKGINSIRKRLADGSAKTYWYAWKGGPPLVGAPGSPEFVRSYQEAHDTRMATGSDQLSSILDAYEDSEAFRSLAPSTAHDYKRYLTAIGREFGDFPLAGLGERGARVEFMRWRDNVAKRSKRTADYGWSVLARVMSWALDRGLVTANPCEKGGRVYRATRADNIWTDADETAFLAVASPQMRLAFMLALWTGQRQGDILRLTWAAYDGIHIRLTQQKTGRRVIVLVGAPLKALLDATPRRSPQIVTNDDGHPFTSSGFRASFRTAQIRAGITGLTFHDIRGSTVTRLAEIGCTELEIASVTGHSSSDVRSILDSAYLSRTKMLGDNAIRKLERRTKPRI
jgi:integrase